MATARKTDNSKSSRILGLLKAKYVADPEGFRSYLPEVARSLDDIAPPSRPHRSPFVLTEGERGYRQQALSKILESMSKAPITKEEAVSGLEHCAALIEDSSLPPEVDCKVLVDLVRYATGKSPGTVKAITTADIPENHGKEISRRLSILRGVTANVSWDMRLVSITINPQKMRERNKALRFVGIAHDLPDVAREHDKYLSQKESLATS